jgi:type IV pilus assembly protein PilQ
MRADIPNVMQPVSNMKYTIEKGKIRFSMSLAGEAWTDVFTLDDEVIILFSVPAKAEKAVVAQQNITGRKEKKADIKEDVQVKDQDQERRVSLDFQDADVTAVLRLLADVSGYNIVVHPEIKGKITMKLINVPWEQALDVVLQTFALGKGMEGNIIKVTPLSILSKDQEDRAKAKEADRKAEPLETKPYRISNADVYDIETAIKDAKVLSERGNISAVANPARDVRTQDQVDKFGSGSSGGGGGGGGTGQSSATGGGENLFRKRTGVLVVTDISAKLLVIDKLVALLDRVPEQVLIEARIVEMDKNNSVDFGVQWGINYKSPNTLNYIGGTNPITGRNYAVDFPAVTSVPNPLLQGAGLAFGLMNLAGTLSLDAKISALEEAKKGKVISMPKILTTSDQKARIIQGESIPYISSMAAGTPPTATVSFKDVAISIHVTPHVTPDGKIVLNVLTLKEDLVEMIDIGGGSQAPRTKKIEGNTRVTVNNGETLVIGGIYQKQEKDETSGTPGLMRIPILGWLFKEQLKEEKVKELVIFITPKIIEPNVAR